MRRKREVREQRILCGDGRYMFVSLHPLYEGQKGRKTAPEQESTVIQKNLNDRNSRRLFHQKALCNFTSEDLFLTLTYSDDFLPATPEQADRELTNFFRRCNSLRRRLGLPLARYMAVTECTVRRSGTHAGSLNFHHHILMDGALDRDGLEELWSRPPTKGAKQGRPLGFANTKRLRLDGNGLEGIMQYIFGPEKQEQQEEAGLIRGRYRRRWRGSKNLKNPKRPRPNDTGWRDSRVERLAREISETGQTDAKRWERQYPGYRFSGCRAEQNPVTGRWSIYLSMHRRN